MTDTIASSFREDFHSKLGELNKLAASQEFSGQGIVIAAGGVSMFTNAYVLIHVLRNHLKCRLPIEVWHYGMAELSPRMQSLLHVLNVDTVDATVLIRAKGAPIRDGWQLKSFALMWSRYSEILLFDADQIPAIDPAAAFEWKEYQESGAVFWPDVLEIKERNPIWNLVGLPPKQMRSFESGQILVDKRRHWKAICATYLLNAAAETVYQLIYGDKDTFLLGWLLSECSFSLVPHLPFFDEFCLTQRDFAGVIFTQHRTNGKWNYSGEQFRLQLALHEDASLAALADLRRQWNGRIFIPAGRSTEARKLERSLIEKGTLQFEIVGGEIFVVEFLPDGEIGRGRNHDRQNWMVVDDATIPQKLKLVFLNGTKPTFWLTLSDGGVWLGERIRKPIAPVIGTPVGEAILPREELDRKTMVDDFLTAANFSNGTRAGDAGLSHALVLLAKIEPDVEARLRVLSARQPSHSQNAARLEALADTVKQAQAEPLRPVNKDGRILESNYI